ncbi:hypothetical protein [Ruegeria sp. MALMAid1280]|uniref:hypothetical protein n=1 Tax=Ruegeria sp. MALMAid1280 TaxID=3411634 RepID=UPI003BA27A4C
MIQHSLKTSWTIGALLVSTMVLATGCVSQEQISRNKERAARDAASKKIVLDACYSAPTSEIENAKSIVVNQGRGDGVYWWWKPSWKETTLAKVNALEVIDLNSSCLPRVEAGCADIGMEPVSGYVSRAQAAAGRGELEIKCSPRLEQT